MDPMVNHRLVVPWKLSSNANQNVMVCMCKGAVQYVAIFSGRGYMLYSTPMKQAGETKNDRFGGAVIVDQVAHGRLESPEIILDVDGGEARQ